MKKLFVLAVLLSGGLMNADKPSEKDKSYYAEIKNFEQLWKQCKAKCDEKISETQTNSKEIKEQIKTSNARCHSACTEIIEMRTTNLEQEKINRILESFNNIGNNQKKIDFEKNFNAQVKDAYEDCDKCTKECDLQISEAQKNDSEEVKKCMTGGNRRCHEQCKNSLKNLSTKYFGN